MFNSKSKISLNHKASESKMITCPSSKNLHNLNDQVISSQLTSHYPSVKSTKYLSMSIKGPSQQKKNSQRLMLGVVLYDKIKHFYEEPSIINMSDLKRAKTTTNQEKKKINLSDHFFDIKFLKSTLTDTKNEMKGMAAKQTATTKQTLTTLVNYEDSTKTTYETMVPIIEKVFIN